MKEGQIKISLKQVIYLLNNGVDGHSQPALMRKDFEGNLFHGIYKDDIDVLSKSDNIQLWFCF